MSNHFGIGISQSLSMSIKSRSDFSEGTPICKSHTSPQQKWVHGSILRVSTSSNYGIAATPQWKNKVLKVLRSEILPNSQHISLKFSLILGHRYIEHVHVASEDPMRALSGSSRGCLREAIFRPFRFLPWCWVGCDKSSQRCVRMICLSCQYVVTRPLGWRGLSATLMVWSNLCWRACMVECRQLKALATCKQSENTFYCGNKETRGPLIL